MAIIRKKKNIFKKPTEQDIAKTVVEWLKKDDWEIYQEVNTGLLSPVADIVAVKNNTYWIIETKINYGLQVLDQALHWIGYGMANYVSIAVLINSHKRQRHKYRHVQHYFHNDKGIGLIIINRNAFGVIDVDRNIKPKLIRLDKWKWNNCIKEYLCEEQKSGVAAGSANGGYETTFKQTVRNIERYIRNNPGKSLKEVIEECGSFHYSNPQSAKQSIATYLRKGIIKNIITKQDGRKYRLYYETKETQKPQNS